MLRKGACVVLVGLLLVHVPVQAQNESPAPEKSRSKASQILWTAAGIGAGFAAGMMIGLSAFDDAIDSDRKVWTSAAVGAAAGGLLGNLIGRQIEKAKSTSLGGPRPLPDIRFASPLPGPSSDGYNSTSIRDLRLRIREASSPARPCRVDLSTCGTLMQD